MAKVYVLWWFDVEDCTVTQSDDAAKRLAMILQEHGARGTFKIVGQKARMMEQRVRYDVIDALKRHDIGFHSNWHGRRPQIAEYLGPLDWDAGVAEFEKREGPGLEDVRRIFGQNPLTYGQPGSNWSPHVFPVLRRWGVPTYISGFGYVGVDCQPFWYGGTLCTSHMYGKRLSGEDQRHLMGLNFELGGPGELDKHKETFSRSREQLARQASLSHGTGGLISILNHPCTLVLEQWFSTNMKPRERTEAGYRHFEEFVKWALALDNVQPTCASGLSMLYADRALERRFSREELRKVAAGLEREIHFQRFDDWTLSAAEAFGMLVACLDAFGSTGELPREVPCSPVYNPIRGPEGRVRDATLSWDAFRMTVRAANEFVGRAQRVPDQVAVADGAVGPGDYLAAVARVFGRLLSRGHPPDQVRIKPAACRFEDCVDEAAARSGWRGAMMPEGFSAPSLLELARLEAWTLKPAVLHARA